MDNNIAPAGEVFSMVTFDENLALDIVGFDPISVEEWQDELEQKLSVFNRTLEDLFEGEFSYEELAIFIIALISLAEQIVDADGEGAVKKDIVMAIWDFYDNQYNLISKLDDEIDFTKSLGSFFGGIVEKVDEKVIRWFVESLLIPMFVKLVFGETKAISL